VDSIQYKLSKDNLNKNERGLLPYIPVPALLRKGERK